MRRSGWVIFAVGLGILAIAIAMYVNAPPKVSTDAFLSGRASFDETTAHDGAVFRAMMVGMLGAFLTLTGILLRATKTLTGAANEVLQESVSHVARGWRSGATSAKDRLAQLETLRRDGLVTEGEYEAKRRDILGDL